MDRSYARRDALRIFRLLLLVQLGLIGLSFLAVLGLWGTVVLGLLLRAAPTLILAVLFVPPWLERVFGRYFLAVGLGLSVLFSSLEMARDFGERASLWLNVANLPPELVEQVAAAPPIEPFLFVLIPLVLFAWGYGRQGALLGSSWAAVLYLVVGIGVTAHGGIPPLSLAQALARISLIYLVPFIVSVLAERERVQHAQLQAALERVRRHAAIVEQLATSRERNRLARELHDTLAHSLAALSVQLEALRTLLINDPEAAVDAVEQISALARQGLEESRNAIQALRTDPVETLGLADALRDVLQSLEARAGVRSRLSTAGQEPDLTLQEAQTLYRIAEEALNNVERHAGANQVAVHLACSADQVELMIHDDGRGFDPNAVEPDRYGLAGMRERAAMIGATLDVRSRPNGGTQVWCTLRR